MWERNTSYVLRFSLLKDGELQLQALYAIQELVHRLEHPTKLLHTILERLYDLELISEESMIEWEKSTDPEEQKGKGVALKTFQAFPPGGARGSNEEEMTGAEGTETPT